MTKQVMKPILYRDVIFGMMKDNKISMRQALTDDWYGIKNVKRYLENYRVSDKDIEFYFHIALYGVNPPTAKQ